MIGILGLWGLYEVYEAMRPLSAPSILALLILGLLPLIWLLAGPMFGFYTPPYPDPARSLVILIAVFAIAMLNIITVGISGSTAIPRGLMEVVSGVLYVGPLFPFFALVRNGPNGIALLVLMLLLVILADTGAFFVGRAIGRHKLAFKGEPGENHRRRDWRDHRIDSRRPDSAALAGGGLEHRKNDRVCGAGGDPRDHWGPG